MTSNKMPLLFDNSRPVDLHEVDDLFGDSVELSLPIRPPQSKALHERIDELETPGCCQAIAWSKAGCITTIHPDGRSVQLRFLRAHPHTGNWALSKPTDFEIAKHINTSPYFAPLVHITPSPTNYFELAAIDAAGRVSIISASTTLNKPSIIRRGEDSIGHDFSTVVGCYWLPTTPVSRQYNILHGPAVRADPSASYQYLSGYIHASGPWHPSPGKSALLCLTSNGALKIYYPQKTGKFEETTLEIDDINASDDWITHASMVSEKGSVYIAFATASKRLRVVKVQISWGIVPQADAKLPANVQVNPTMIETRLATTSWLQTDPLTPDPSVDSPMTRLSHLEILPSVVDVSGNDRHPPMILTVRSRIPTASSQFQEPLSIIDRWTVVSDQVFTLSSAFEQLNTRKNGTGSDAQQPTTRLQKIEPLVVNKIVIGITSLQFGKVLCLAFGDGSVQHHDRWTMEELYKIPSLDKVMNLNQIGFKFSEEAPSLQVAFSPTHFSIVQIREDGEVRWNRLHYPSGEIGESRKDSPYSAIIAGLTLAAVAATYYMVNCDDVLAIARVFSRNQRFATDWATDYIKMSKITVDYTSDSHHDGLVRNTGLQSCLTIINHLGFRGEHERRTFSGKFAFLALNMRNIILIVQIAHSPMPRMNPFDEPEVVDTLVGCVKWSLDLISWISDRLFALLDDGKFTELMQPKTLAGATAYLQEMNDVALHLLLCSSTRGFLVALCRRINHLEDLARRAIEFWEKGSSAPNPQLRAAYGRMQTVAAGAAVKPADFELLLSQFGSDIRDAYKEGLAKLASRATSHSAQSRTPLQGKQLDEQLKMAQTLTEISLLLCQTPPTQLLQPIAKLFAVHARVFRSKLDREKVFFRNYDLLEVEDRPVDLEGRRARGRYVDILRKVEMVPVGPSIPDESDTGSDARMADWSETQSTTMAAAAAAADNTTLSTMRPRWRRCTRCTAVMEDVTTKRPAATFVLSQRKCACSGVWALLPRGSLEI